MTKFGVVLLNMGGPETLDDVRPFLFNLFSDREIIKLGPWFMQKPLAWYISKKRAPKSMKLYSQIGGGSPLTRITQAQARALEDELSEYGEYCVVTAMRYWEPTADIAVKQLEEQGVDRVIAIPLYPHFSRATSGSSLTDFKKKLAASKLASTNLKIEEISSWPLQEQYIDCLVENIREGISQFNGLPVQLVFSAHSLPVSFIDEGDPYVDQIQQTISKIESITNIESKLCYQSKSGPVEWLAPSTSDTIKDLAAKGCKNLLVVPISFVSDHVETLYEIDIMFKEEAKELGMRLEMTKGLNTQPKFIECLRNLVLSATE